MPQYSLLLINKEKFSLPIENCGVEDSILYLCVLGVQESS